MARKDKTVRLKGKAHRVPPQPVEVPPPATVNQAQAIVNAAREHLPILPGKPWSQMTETERYRRALEHFGIRKGDVLSYRVYPHKVAIVYGYGQKVEYWPD